MHSKSGGICSVLTPCIEHAAYCLRLTCQTPKEVCFSFESDRAGGIDQIRSRLLLEDHYLEKPIVQASRQATSDSGDAREKSLKFSSTLHQVDSA